MQEFRRCLLGIQRALNAPLPLRGRARQPDPSPYGEGLDALEAFQLDGCELLLAHANHVFDAAEFPGRYGHVLLESLARLVHDRFPPLRGRLLTRRDEKVFVQLKDLR